MTILAILWGLGVVLVWRWLAQDRPQANKRATVLVALTWPAVTVVALLYLVLDTQQRQFERQAHLAGKIHAGISSTDDLRGHQMTEFGMAGAMMLKNDLNALARGGHVIDTGVGWVSSETSAGETLQ